MGPIPPAPAAPARLGEVALADLPQDPQGGRQRREPRDEPLAQHCGGTHPRMWEMGVGVGVPEGRTRVEGLRDWVLSPWRLNRQGQSGGGENNKDDAPQKRQGFVWEEQHGGPSYPIHRGPAGGGGRDAPL